MTRKALLVGLLLVGGTFLSACGSTGEAGVSEAYVAPAGSGATLVSHTVPLAMAPGERRVVTVTMQNSGTTPGVNDWTPSSYRLMSIGTWFGWPHTFVTSAVPVGNSHVFTFIIQAPSAPATYNFRARMYAPTGNFGDELNLMVVVSGATTADYACAFEAGMSTIPATIAPGANDTAVVTVRNVGTQPWPAGYLLYSQDSPVNLWGNTGSPVTATVAPGATVTFNIPLAAPATPGAYSLRRQMRSSAGGVGIFSSMSCVDVPITVGGAATLDAALVSQDFPLTMAPGEVRSVTVVMQNTGTETWATGGNYFLNALNSNFGVTVVSLTSATGMGANATFTFNITAPTTPGSYNHQWRMRKGSGAGAGRFGATIDIPMMVDMSTPPLDAGVVSQVIPMLVTAGRPVTFRITMQNTGTATWTSATSLDSTNSPANLWGFTNQALGGGEMVGPMATREFVLTLTAPATPGTYSSRWRMRQGARFGEEAITNGIVVTLCGNGTVDAGETCDDSNLTAGDGCSTSCQVEQVIVDLATDAAGRTLVGTATSAQLGQVAIGDVTADTVADVIVAQAPSPAGVPFRSAGGSVYGFLGGAGFFTGGSSTVATGSAFQIAGAEAADNLGQVASGILGVGDVTGDGTADLIIAAPGADGVMNARSNCGEVYVFTGSMGLASAGLIDLGAMTPSTHLAATFVGATSGDGLQVAAIGDVTGDGVADIVLAAPLNDTNGADAGAVYVVTGGAGVTGTIDLAAPPAGVFTILGAAAGDRLGSSAAVGDFGGSSAGDLLVGAQNAAPGGRTRAGAAYGLFGPLSAGLDLGSSSADVTWLGRAAFEGLASSAGIANVVGTGGDVILGAIQWERAAGVQAGAVLVFAGPVAPGTYDLSITNSATTTILGADQYDDTGTSLALGDVNMDGVADLLLSASAADGPTNVRSGAGETTVVFGAATLPATIDLASHLARFRMYGAASSDFMGRHRGATSLADVDGDGHADICVGSYRGGTGAATVPGRVDCILSPF